MIHPLTHLTIMIEQPRPPPPLHNTMMTRPSHHRLQQSSPIRKRTQRIIAYRIADIMRITRGVTEIILAIMDMHPGSLEEAARVVGAEDGGVSRWVEDI